jgi:hypothetical protein
MTTLVKTDVDKTTVLMSALELMYNGCVIPSLTTANRDLLVGVPAGVVIYNTTTNKLNVRVAAAWEAVTSA